MTTDTLSAIQVPMATPKKKRGRPNLGLGEVLIALRMPAALRAAARVAAEAEGVKVSEWWRRAAMARIQSAGFTAAKTKGRK